QAAVDANVGKLAELVNDLLRGTDQRIAAMAGDEVRLMSRKRLVVERLGLHAENPQKIFGSLPVTLLDHIIVQIVLGFLLGLAADDVDMDPDSGFAPVRASEILKMRDLSARPFQECPILENDEIHVA